MKISVFSQSLFALDLDAAIQTAADIGFDAIELACAKPHFDISMAGKAQEIARRIQDAGLSVSALSQINSFTVRETLQEQIRQAQAFLNLAGVFGTSVVKLTPGNPASAEATDDQWRLFLQAMEILATNAKALNVKLAVETHMRHLTDTVAGSLRLLDNTPADTVGLTVDFSNLMFASESLDDVFEKLMPRAFNTHVKNGYIAPDGSWKFTKLDEGWTDYGQIMPRLKESGYDGYLSIECLGADAAERPVETAARDFNILKDLLEKT